MGVIRGSDKKSRSFLFGIHTRLLDIGKKTMISGCESHTGEMKRMIMEKTVISRSLRIILQVPHNQADHYRVSRQKEVAELLRRKHVFVIP